MVLKQYPTFLPGFVSRSEAKRKLGDNVGADRDYWAAIKMEEQAKNGQLPKTSSSGSNTAVNGDTKTDDSEENTREQSDKNINKFNRLVVYDKEQERKSKYQSEVRGRVQDRNVHVDLEPQFVLTYYEKADPVKKLVYYDKMVEDYNGQMVLKRKLRITNEEAALTEDQIAVHFASIESIRRRSSVIRTTLTLILPCDGLHVGAGFLGGDQEFLGSDRARPVVHDGLFQSCRGTL